MRDGPWATAGSFLDAITPGVTDTSAPPQAMAPQIGKCLCRGHMATAMVMI